MCVPLAGLFPPAVSVRPLWRDCPGTFSLPDSSNFTCLPWILSCLCKSVSKFKSSQSLLVEGFLKSSFAIFYSSFIANFGVFVFITQS